MYFFFQAEDGIRDYKVTGVQTCALPIFRRPPAISWRKVGMMSSHHGLYVQGYTRATMAGTKRCKPARGSQSQKTGLSSDRRLQLACVKLESLVMPYQNDGVNTFPGLVHTARHITKVDCTRSPNQTSPRYDS